MITHARVRIVLTFAALAGLAGCASSSTAGTTGQGMMGSDSQYHLSGLKCGAPATLPGVRVAVAVSDMGLTSMMGGTAPMGARMRLWATPDSVPAGAVSFVVTNVGWRTHEVVVLPLSAGAVAGQRQPGPDGKVDEAGSLGEVSNTCAGGSGDGVAAGTTGWNTLTLKPGRYELVCNLPNHYADGMYQDFTVA